MAGYVNGAGRAAFAVVLENCAALVAPFYFAGVVLRRLAIAGPRTVAGSPQQN